jgi:hypothetical protein
MFGGSYGSFTVVCMHIPEARPASARGAAGGPTCIKHGAARRPGACCSDERVGVTPIRSKPTDTAAAGGRQAPLIFPVTPPEGLNKETRPPRLASSPAYSVFSEK